MNRRMNEQIHEKKKRTNENGITEGSDDSIA